MTGGTPYFWASEHHRSDGRLRVRKVRFTTPEEREAERLELLEELVRLYPFTYSIPAAAKDRWGHRIRREGASAVSIPVSDSQRLLLLNQTMGLTCGDAADLDLCRIAAIKHKNRMTYIGVKLSSGNTTNPQVRGEWARLGHGVTPAQVGKVAREKGLVMHRTPGGGRMTETGMAAGAAVALLVQAQSVVI